MTSRTGDDERQLLLPSDDGSQCQSETSQSRPWEWIQEAATFLKDPILICTFCLQSCTYFAKHIVEVPLIRLLEEAICNKYYASNRGLVKDASTSIDEAMCKIPPIQNKMATIVGLKFTFDALPGKTCCVDILINSMTLKCDMDVGLLTALYYGALADRSAQLSCILVYF